MPFDIPRLAELSARARAAFRAELPGSDAALWPNNISVSAKVLAMLNYEHWLRMGWMFRQMFARTADAEILEWHAADYGLARKPAAQAEGMVRATGLPGTLVPSGMGLTRSDGRAYVTVSDAPIGQNGAALVRVRAAEAGAAGNTLPDAVMSFAEPRSGLDPQALVAADGLGSGADVESDDDLRARVLFRKRHVPMGGAAHDYVIWATQVPGVTRVFVEPMAYGLGTVGIWFLMDDAYPNGIPQPADVAALKSYLDALAPATAIVCVAAPVPLPVDVTVRGLSPDTAAVREAVIAELRDAFVRQAEPGAPVRPFRFSRSWLWEAVASATGEYRHEIVVPGGDVMAPSGALPVLGAVRFAS